MEVKTSKQRAIQYSRPARLLIGLRLRQLREQKGLSQRDVEERAGLLKCYISRVENGHKLPSLKTLERFALALDVPLCRLLSDGEERLPTRPLISEAALEDLGKDAPYPDFVQKLGHFWAQMGHFERQFLLGAAKRMAASNPKSQHQLKRDQLHQSKGNRVLRASSAETR